MIHFDIPKPDISPDFTIEDLHKIREWNYERFKDATPEERRQYYRAASERFNSEVQEMRSQTAA